MAVITGKSQMSVPLVGESDTKKFISEWKVGQKTICLFRYGDRLAFSTEGRAGQTSEFKSTLYDVNYAINLIHMFHKTIEKNLENENPHSSCFLPKLCTEAYKEPEIQVALFGRIDPHPVVTGEPKGLRWGVFNKTTKEEHAFDVTDDVAEVFLRYAPNHNRSHITYEVDIKGNQVEKEGKEHFLMNYYIKRFCVELIKDQTNHIQRVVLHHVSLLDKNVFLNQKNWAVTLVSTNSRPSNFFSWAVKKKPGHAMLACEGVDDQGKAFLIYVHLTQEPRDRNPNLASDEAQIESFERKSPLSTKNGPTWLRTRKAVENMFKYLETTNGKRIKFSKYREALEIRKNFDIWKTSRKPKEYDNSGDKEALEILKNNYPNINTIPVTEWLALGILGNVNSELCWSPTIDISSRVINRTKDPDKIKQMLKEGHEISEDEYFSEITKSINQSVFSFEDFRKNDPTIDQMPSNCLSVAMHIAQYAGIIFLRTALLRTPLEKIDILNQKPFVLLPNNFDRSYLGRLFGASDEEKELSKKIVEACVMLIAEDTTPEEFHLWERQWVIETTRFYLKGSLAQLNAEKKLAEAIKYKVYDDMFDSLKSHFKSISLYPPINHLREF